MARGRTASDEDVRGRETAAPRLDLDRYVPALLAFLANKLAKTATTTYQRRFKVNVTEWRILSLLAIEPAIPAARICHVIGFDKGPVSRTLAALQGKGLVDVTVDPGDARRRLISLTDAGTALHDRIILVALERERRLLSCLTAEQRNTLIHLLGALHDNLPAVTRPGDATPDSGR
ncbi:MarR family winged helix-turn-helix transcriptional regulator [Chelatococcus reniformis]|uniref:Transcriptional regulator n=1 Tax=Chelatococcus reniformis TaxID=1494448 RepID=A0A916TWI4_9HYPH|nr:MarR family transcriptional regulator [Chelatococcus reniformis]GGC47098.1 transcriptional regulator [Chelatococcus reniformis]